MFVPWTIISRHRFISHCNDLSMFGVCVVCNFKWSMFQTFFPSRAYVTKYSNHWEDVKVIVKGVWLFEMKMGNNIFFGITNFLSNTNMIYEWIEWNYFQHSTACYWNTSTFRTWLFSFSFWCQQKNHKILQGVPKKCTNRTKS